MLPIVETAEALYAELRKYVPDNHWTPEAGILLGEPGVWPQKKDHDNDGLNKR